MPRWLADLAPERATLKQDMVAGIPGAISSVPDGMAAGVLAGVNPVHGLYASIFGPVGGGLTSSSKLMVITTTSAAALAAGSAVAGVPADRRSEALFLLTLIAGALMIAAAALRMGRFTRFVPHSVMIGFLTGVAVNIVLGQLPDLVGSDVSGDIALAKAWHLLLDLGSIDPASLIAGVSAIAHPGAPRPHQAGGLLVTHRTSHPHRGGDRPGSGHCPARPRRGRDPPGPANASVSAAQRAVHRPCLGRIRGRGTGPDPGRGVSESAPNPDGSRAEPNRDFLAQGVGNVLSGLFRGQPVGGSVGQTALSVAAGARSRWAAIFAGIWMAIILLAFSGLVGAVVMPTLAAVLIVAAIGSLRTGQVRAIMRTSRISQIAVCATFVATLLLPVAAAVGLGVVFALLMQLNREALDLRIVELVPTGTGSFLEKPAPSHLKSKHALLLDIYGSLYYAGARTLQAHLPDPEGSTSPAVVIRLRGRALLGATSYAVLSDYAARIATVGGRLYLTGLDPEVLAQVQRNRTVETAGDVRLFQATDTLGEASLDAYHHAERWLAEQP